MNCLVEDLDPSCQLNASLLWLTPRLAVRPAALGNMEMNC